MFETVGLDVDVWNQKNKTNMPHIWSHQQRLCEKPLGARVFLIGTERARRDRNHAAVIGMEYIGNIIENNYNIL